MSKTTKPSSIKAPSVKALLANMKDLIFVFEMDSAKLVFANEKALQILGYSFEELCALPLDHWRKPMHGQPTMKKLLQQLKEKKHAITHSSLITKEGKELPMESRCNCTIINGVDYSISSAQNMEEILYLREHEQLMCKALDETEDLAFMADEKANFVYVNKAASAYTGYTENELLQMNIAEVDIAFDMSNWAAYFNALEAAPINLKTRHQRIKTRHQRKDGSEYPVEVHISQVTAGSTHYVLGIARDMTETYQMIDAIHKQTQQLKVIENFQSQFIIQTDPFDMYEKLKDDLIELSGSELGFIGEVLNGQNNQLYLKIYALSNISWNSETKRLYEENKRKGLEFHNLDNLFGRAILDREIVLSNQPQKDERAKGLPPGHPPIESFLGLPVFFGSRLVGEIGLANRPGGYDEQMIELLKPLAKTCGQIIVARQEKEARESAERKLKEINRRDALTGLYNRRYFNEQVITELRRCIRNQLPLTMIMIDIDDFKRYNDSYGHLKGDECLISVAKAVNSCINRAGDFIARFGGEEFIALLPNTDMEGAIKIAQCFQEKLKQTAIAHKASSVSPFVTISVGISSNIPTIDTDYNSLIDQADSRLYLAKKRGKNTIVFQDENSLPVS